MINKVDNMIQLFIGQFWGGEVGTEDIKEIKESLYNHKYSEDSPSLEQQWNVINFIQSRFKIFHY